MATPMQQQYNDIKAKYPDSILLFRLGDFYETFNEDAISAAKILGITLTGRGIGENRLPMAGIPYHALNNYLPKLMNAGKKVAIVDQQSEPMPGKLVDREVTEIITPGTIIDANLLPVNSNNFLGCIFLKSIKNVLTVAMVFIDLSTNELQALEIIDNPNNLTTTKDTLLKYNCREIIVNEQGLEKYKQQLSKEEISSLEIINAIPEGDFDIVEGLKEIQVHYNINGLKAWGINNDSNLIGVLNAARKYLKENLKRELNIAGLKQIYIAEQVNIPWSSYKALEIFSDSQGNLQNSLFNHLNKTLTRSGERKLKQWLLNVLYSQSLINERLVSVSQLRESLQNLELKTKLADFLKEQLDYERFLSKENFSRLNPTDLIAFSRGIRQIESIKNYLPKLTTGIVSKLHDFNLVELIVLVEEYERSVIEGFSDLSNYGFINPAYDSNLQEIASQVTKGREFLKNLEESEINNTGINSLKVRYNKVFGYFIEVSKSNISKVPLHYIRKQTLVNAERYITEDLKKWEEIILANAEIRLAKEKEIFQILVLKLKPLLQTIKTLGELISEFDVLHNFALISLEYDYIKPEIVKDKELEITGLRHPVLSSRLGHNYQNNDVKLNTHKSIILITGPNMSGKSTYIRSIAICSLLAQIGSYVPASSAKLTLVDGIYTRIGSSDNINQNESTFMVEMIEMAYILNHATTKSLIILDEVGRGTSTYDGVALAWALVEYLAVQITGFCLFATHYHELIELEKNIPNIVNYYVEAIPGEKLTFTHKVLKGSLNKIGRASCRERV